MKGTKHDDGKLRWDLLPILEVEQIVDVITYGAEKYDDNNWQKVDSERYYAAMMRHIVAWRKGNKRDVESKLLHLAHAMCCGIFLMWHDRHDDSVWTDSKIKIRSKFSDADVPTTRAEDFDEIRQDLAFNLARRWDQWDSEQCCIFCGCLVCGPGCGGYARQQYLLGCDKENTP